MGEALELVWFSAQARWAVENALYLGVKASEAKTPVPEATADAQRGLLRPQPRAARGELRLNLKGTGWAGTGNTSPTPWCSTTATSATPAASTPAAAPRPTSPRPRSPAGTTPTYEGRSDAPTATTHDPFQRPMPHHQDHPGERLPASHPAFEVR